ncbi:hypothetical protein UY3_15180 [Chelonia mydas]|uniref:Uncharacterized protein n=1 Tax=Chelonia mydas TaxID=8469 RepID=M7BHK8_CHEMY|nr:hypothetical protein UY3_15180 [Chelonia mydas]
MAGSGAAIRPRRRREFGNCSVTARFALGGNSAAAPSLRLCLRQQGFFVVFFATWGGKNTGASPGHWQLSSSIDHLSSVAYYKEWFRSQVLIYNYRSLLNPPFSGLRLHCSLAILGEPPPVGGKGQEDPRKTRKGGTDAEPSALPTGVFHPPVPAGEDVAAPEGSISPPRESLPSETPQGAPSALVPSEASVSPEATIASGASGENPGVAESDLPSIYEEIKALGLTPVIQGVDDPMPAGLDLGDLTPAPLFPCSIPLTAISAPTSEEPLDSSINLATDVIPLTATEPVEVTASATRPVPEPPGAPLVGVEQLTSILGGGPTGDSPPPDAMAAKPTKSCLCP